jgi:alkylhydroperoxidase family enzyme
VARIAYVDPETCDNPSLALTFDAIGEVRGGVSNLFRLVGNCPTALVPFFAMSRFIRDESSISARLREIAILVTAYSFGVPYEIAAHTVAGREAGLTDSELSKLANADDTGFSATERAVIHYAAEVSDGRKVSDASFAELQDRLSEPQILELALVVAWYHLVAAVIVPLRIDLDPELESEFGDANARGR